MVLHLDASIDKVENLARDVELDRISRKDTEREMEPVTEEISHLLPVTAVAESSEYQYGAEVFEAAYPAIKQEKILEAKAPAVPKTEKSR